MQQEEEEREHGRRIRLNTFALRLFADVCPRAAGRPDRDGRLPLHVALEAGRDWCDGGAVRVLLEAHPDGSVEPDAVTGLWPFMAAAAAAAVGSSSSSSLDTVFELLRRQPHLVQMGILIVGPSGGDGGDCSASACGAGMQHRGKKRSRAEHECECEASELLPRRCEEDSDSDAASPVVGMNDVVVDVDDVVVPATIQQEDPSYPPKKKKKKQGAALRVMSSKVRRISLP